MKIYGIGTDFVSKERIKRLMEQYPDQFIMRILSAQEQEECKTRSQVDYVAKRFAAKEAVAKALGTGIGETVRFNEISITNLPSGKPVVALLNRAQSLITDLNIQSIHVSLSDDKHYAMAFVVIEV